MTRGLMPSDPLALVGFNCFKSSRVSLNRADGDVDIFAFGQSETLGTLSYAVSRNDVVLVL